MKKIIDDIHLFKGNLLLICVENNKIIEKAMKNKNISIHELVRNKKRKIFSKNKKVNNKKGKSVNIKKFRKLFKKKSVEYLIVDLNNIFDFYKYIAANSIYVCKNKIYIYGSSDYLTAKDVEKKFTRYNTKTETIQNGNDYLVIIDCSKAKYSYIKEKIYLCIDTLHNLGDMISYLLTS